MLTRASKRYQDPVRRAVPPVLFYTGIITSYDLENKVYEGFNLLTLHALLKTLIEITKHEFRNVVKVFKM